MLTEEQKKEIEELYNFYNELYKEKEDPVDQKYYIGKCSGIEDVMSRLGYKTKIMWGFVSKEEE